MAKEQYLPGSVSFPTHHMKCRACGHEFDLSCSYEEADNATCEACSSSDVEEEYLSFPTDGPGFQEGYAKLHLDAIPFGKLGLK